MWEIQYAVEDLDAVRLHEDASGLSRDAT